MSDIIVSQHSIYCGVRSDDPRGCTCQPDAPAVLAAERAERESRFYSGLLDVVRRQLALIFEAHRMKGRAYDPTVGEPGGGRTCSKCRRIARYDVRVCPSCGTIAR